MTSAVGGPGPFFEDPLLYERLETLGSSDLDHLDFGVVRMSVASEVTAYNRFESTLSGLGKERVVGRHFFTRVAPCTNNALVAGRFAEPDLDCALDYTFSYKMAPTPVRLRLLRRADGTHQYLCVRPC